MIVTFCRVRPALLVNELTATTRRREGTTVIEVSGLTPEISAVAASGGLLPVSTEPPGETTRRPPRPGFSGATRR